MLDPVETETWQIREPDKADLGKMARIFRGVQEMHYEKFPDIFSAPADEDENAAYIEGYFQPRNPFRKRVQFVAGWYPEGELQGFVLYQLYQSSNVIFGKDRWNCFVVDIAVSENYQSKGGASLMMQYLLDQVTPLGECMMSAQIWQGNTTSAAFFEKNGFSPVSQNFYRCIKAGSSHH